MVKMIYKIRQKIKSRQKIGYWELVIGNCKRGFTLAEIMIAATILGILIMSASAIYTNFYNSVNNLKAANLIYDEARYVMERIVREVRNGTIDYEEYYNQKYNFGGEQGITSNDEYGQNYCQYSRQFYNEGPDGQYGTYDDESRGKKEYPTDKTLDSIIQDNLYLINAAGDKRTYIKRSKVDGVGKVAMLKLTGKDYGMDHINTDGFPMSNPCQRDGGEKDGLIDTWECDPGFICKKNIIKPPSPCAGQSYDKIFDYPSNIPPESSFVDITPTTLDIVNLKFFITPTEDPYKAYNDSSVQIQPHVTIKLYARANSKLVHQATGGAPDIVLESTVSARAYNEIITACNLQECIDGDPRPCPKKPCPTTGTCEIVEVKCSQGVWPVCSDKNYYDFVFTKYGQPNGIFASTGDAKNNTYFETDNEIGSCGFLFSADISKAATCKNERCTDGFDNDGNGLADKKDPTCVWELCKNGIHDPPVEDCTDVGGDCSWRPLELNGETDCADGYDNDCSYNSKLKWGDLTEEQQDELPKLGYSSASSVNDLNKALGLGADEFDKNCIKLFCEDIKESPKDFDPADSFVDKNYTQINYLVGVTGNTNSDLNENCPDIGGLCAYESKKTIDGVKITKAKETTSDPALNPLSEWSSCLDLFKKVSNVDPVYQQNIDIKECKEYKCSDNYDNDCDGKADELDTDCKDVICKNSIFDSLLVWSLSSPQPHSPANLITSESATIESGITTTDLDEQCLNTGGLCGPLPFGNQPATEQNPVLCNNGLDDDCDTQDSQGQPNPLGGIDEFDDDCCPDNDNDGYSPIIGDKPAPDGILLCKETQPVSCSINGFMCTPLNGTPGEAFPYGKIDCNDYDKNIYPQIIEKTCDDATYPTDYIIKALQGAPIDENCSGANKVMVNGLPIGSLDSNDPSCCKDLDNDGYGDQNAYIYSEASHNYDADSDGDTTDCMKSAVAPKKYDCDDLDKDRNPGLPEICDGKDNDCDDLVDEEGSQGCTPFYKDADKDNYGVTGDSKCLCTAAGDYVATLIGDCADTIATIHPTQPESCDGIDNDCDGNLDNSYNVGTSCNNAGIGACYAEGIYECDGLNNTKCNAVALPPAPNEICNDNIDNDCDGIKDEPLPDCVIP